MRLDRKPLSPYPAVHLSPVEVEELQALVDQAWELKRADSPYMREAAEAIVAWRERLALTRLERKQRQLARLVHLLRETDPRSMRRAAA